MESKSDLLRKSIKNIDNKLFKILFYVPDTDGTPSAAVAEIYNHVRVLKRNGFDAYVLTEKKDYAIPSYLEEELQAMPHLSSEGTSFKVAPEDWFVIPEYFTNLMKQVDKLPCGRIVLAQSLDYVIDGLVPGMKWKDLGIKNVISTNETLTEKIKELHGATAYDIQNYKIGVPEYFKQNNFKKPIISFYIRNRHDIKKINKMFYLKYPELTWVLFEDLKGKTREDFAKSLAESALVIWVDKISSFGTLPIEAMKVGTPIVGMVPDLIQPFVNQETGFWTDNILNIPDLTAKVFKAHLEDVYPKEMEDATQAVAASFNMEESNTSIMSTYSHFFNKKKTELDNAFIALERGRQLLDVTNNITPTIKAD
jgi:hypothetical protein